MAMGLLGHHLAYLEERGIISSRRDRYYMRYYTADVGAQDRTVISAIRQERPRAIVLLLLLHPGLTHSELMEHLGISASTLSFYLKDLMEKGVVSRQKVGRESSFRVVAGEAVVRALVTYRPSFLDEVVDRFLELWFEKGK